MILLACIGAAFAAPEEPDVLRRAVVSAGVASQWIVAGSGPAWAPALSQRLQIGGPVGREGRGLLGFGLTHARVELRDAGELVSGAAPTSISGTRDELGLALAWHTTLDVDAELPEVNPVLRVLPVMGLSAGVLITDAQLDAAGFDAPVLVRSRAFSPSLAAVMGFELRLYGFVSLVPRGDVAVTLGANRAEQSGGERFAAEWRLSAGTDLAVRF